MDPQPRRARGHIEWEPIDERLRSTRSEVLSTTRPDGRPHAIPTWFSWVGNRRLYFITARPTQKAANLRRQEWIIAHFGDGDDVLFAEGRARVVTDEAELPGRHGVSGQVRRSH